MTTNTFELLSSTARSLDASIKLMQESKDACDCMDLEMVLEQFLAAVRRLREIDEVAMNEIRSGEKTVNDHVDGATYALAAAFLVLTVELRKRAIHFAELGHIVRGLNELLDFDPFHIRLFDMAREIFGTERDASRLGLEPRRSEPAALTGDEARRAADASARILRSADDLNEDFAGLR